MIAHVCPLHALFFACFRSFILKLLQRDRTPLMLALVSGSIPAIKHIVDDWAPDLQAQNKVCVLAAFSVQLL